MPRNIQHLERAGSGSYFQSINQLNLSCQQQLVLQLWMDHIQCVAHRVVVDIWEVFVKYIITTKNTLLETMKMNTDDIEY